MTEKKASGEIATIKAAIESARDKGVDALIVCLASSDNTYTIMVSGTGEEIVQLLTQLKENTREVPEIQHALRDLKKGGDLPWLWRDLLIGAALGIGAFVTAKILGLS